MSNPDSLLARLRHAMHQTAIHPHSFGRIADNTAWCVSFGRIDGFYADIDICDNGNVWGSHFGPDMRSRAYAVGSDARTLRRWLIFAHAWSGDLHTTAQKLLLASHMTHNEACVQIQ